VFYNALILHYLASYTLYTRPKTSAMQDSSIVQAQLHYPGSFAWEARHEPDYVDDDDDI
jgi:hypothetical protein